MSFHALNNHFNRLIHQASQVGSQSMAMVHEAAGNVPAPNLTTNVTNTPHGAQIVVQPVVGSKATTKDAAMHAKLLKGKLLESAPQLAKKVIQ